MWRFRIFKQIFLIVLALITALVVVNIFSMGPYQSRLMVNTPINARKVQPEAEVTKTSVPNIPGLKRFIKDVSCSKVIEGYIPELKLAKTVLQRTRPVRTSDSTFLNLTKKCDVFRLSRGYDAIPISKEEKDFPIAYTILMYRDVDQTERLIRAIYRKHNVYCIHVDASAPRGVLQAMAAVASCLRNVFLVSNAEDVLYEGFSRLKADLNCMQDLINHKVKWKYLINLPSQQFPLKTNLELVKVLKIYNGANDIEGITVPGRMFSVRYKYKHKLGDNKKLVRTSMKKEKPPHNITLVKGSAYGVFSRAFVNFTLHDQRVQDFLEWNKEIRSPDEYFWATLHHSKVLNAPGSYTAGIPDKKPWLAVYAAWGGRDRCHGKFVRGVCVFGVGDLTELVSRKELFANKFYIDYQHLALDCMEEYIYNKSFSNVPFETFYYRSLPFIIKDALI